MKEQNILSQWGLYLGVSVLPPRLMSGMSLGLDLADGSMFEKPTPKSPSNKRMSLPSRQPSRRSSIQNVAIIPAARFVGEGDGEGEASMEMDTASEASDTSEDEDDHAPELHGARYTVQHVEHIEDGGSEDGEGEMDMEVTQVVGGIMDTSIVSEGDSLVSAGEDQTVDFTIAVGGLMPHSPPVEGAPNTRVSMGYAAPSSPSRYHPGQEEVPMEETVAIGGIIGDDTMSTTSSGDQSLARERTMTFSYPEDGMEMTVAMGGVMSPFRPITRPTTPFFARPTVSSATKTSASKPKRNIFGPSPSPVKTPKKGMEVAGEVAKRLSFGSNVSSGSKKRARSESIGEESPKRRMEESVFTQRVTKQRTESLVDIGTPRKGLSVMPSKSPAKSPMLRRMLGQQTEDVDLGQEEFEPQTITLGSFLEMAGVQFIEAPPGVRRRSSVGRGVLGNGMSAMVLADSR